jgi:hypothetical protein
MLHCCTSDLKRRVKIKRGKTDINSTAAKINMRRKNSDNIAKVTVGASETKISCGETNIVNSYPIRRNKPKVIAVDIAIVASTAVAIGCW